MKVKKIIDTHRMDTKEKMGGLSLENIKRLKDKGLISEPKYNVPNHLYFYQKNKKDFTI